MARVLSLSCLVFGHINDQHATTLYSVSDGTRRPCEEMEEVLRGKRSWVTSRGWLLLWDPATLATILWNPLAAASDGDKIALPPWASPPASGTDCALSGEPTDPGGCTVVVLERYRSSSDETTMWYCHAGGTPSPWDRYVYDLGGMRTPWGKFAKRFMSGLAACGGKFYWVDLAGKRFIRVGSIGDRAILAGGSSYAFAGWCPANEFGLLPNSVYWIHPYDGRMYVYEVGFNTEEGGAPVQRPNRLLSPSLPQPPPSLPRASSPPSPPASRSHIAAAATRLPTRANPSPLPPPRLSPFPRPNPRPAPVGRRRRRSPRPSSRCEGSGQRGRASPGVRVPPRIRATVAGGVGAAGQPHRGGWGRHKPRRRSPLQIGGGQGQGQGGGEKKTFGQLREAAAGVLRGIHRRRWRAEAQVPRPRALRERRRRKVRRLRWPLPLLQAQEVPGSADDSRTGNQHEGGRDPRGRLLVAQVRQKPPVENALDSAVDATRLSCGALYLADFIGKWWNQGGGNNFSIKTVGESRHVGGLFGGRENYDKRMHCLSKEEVVVHARMRRRAQFSCRTFRNIIVLSIITEEHYLSSFGSDAGISPELHRLKLS
ncbi:uncharacterized protein LOC125554831 [Triticum urartu]|nr:uncharacterized protein LOC125554831 [Triticum urartu]